MIEFSDFALEHPTDYNYDDDDDYDYGDDEQDEASKCQFDVLTIEEYDSGGSLIQSKKHCETMPKKMNTTNVVLVKFESDYSNTDRGFHLEYMVEGCGKVLKKPEGEFSSPGYPQPYPHNMQCLWTIDVDYGHLVEITFEDYDFESSDDCILDGLIVSRNKASILFCAFNLFYFYSGFKRRKSNKSDK